MKHYFSKLYLKWMPLKSSDCEATLKKYGYEIRTINTVIKEEI